MADSLPEMLAALAKVFPSGPSWPFRTQSARSVWDEAEAVFDKNPNWPLYMVVKEAMYKAGIPSNEFVAEDYAVLSMAMRWKARQLQSQGKRTKGWMSDISQPVIPPPAPSRR